MVIDRQSGPDAGPACCVNLLPVLLLVVVLLLLLLFLNALSVQLAKVLSK